MCKSSTITIASFIKVKIIESWLERKGSIQIGKEPQLHNQTIASSVDNFGHRRNLEAEKIGNRTCLAQTDNGSANKECSKKKQWQKAMFVCQKMSSSSHHGLQKPAPPQNA